MYCDNCGASIDSTSQFCTQCGSRVDGKTTTQRKKGRAVSRAKTRSSSKLLVSVLIISIPLVIVGFIFLRAFSTDEISEARKVLTQAAQSAESIEDPLWKAITFDDLARMQSKLGDKTSASVTINKSKEAAAGIENQSLKVNIIATIAATQARITNRSSAEIVMRDLLQTSTMGRDDLRRQTETSLAYLDAATGDVSAAFTRIAKIPDRIEKNMTLYNITNNQARWGEVQEALQTANHINDGGWRVEALTRVAVAQAKTGDRQGAIATFRQALQTAEGFEDGPQKAAIFITIATAQGDAADRTAAGSTIQRAIQAGLATASDYEKRDLAIAYAKSGELKKAYAIMSTIVQDYEKDIVLESLAITEAQNGNIEAAHRTAATIKNGTRGVALRGIAAAQAKTGDIKGAIEWAAKQPSPFSKASALLGVAEGILERRQAGKPKSGTVKQ